ncbi:hypothetical protein [Agaribacterium sp. ZY112]|uniref:hypothetical protein n=1 Tax=Agaribacterium sp. ZY112 TaxID=3233574 RepID=UPI0035247EF6
MRFLLIAAMALCAAPLSSMGAHAQDYSFYESLSVDELIEQAKKSVGRDGAVGGAQLVSPAAEVAVEGELSTMPYRCANYTLMRFMSMSGFPTDDLPAINFCVEMHSKDEVVATFHIPENLATKLRGDVRVGDVVRLWGRWIYTIEFSKRPYLLLDDYKLSPDGKASSE